MSSNLVYSTILLGAYGYDIRLDFNGKITVLEGDSGSGKSMLYQVLSKLNYKGSKYTQIQCLNRELIVKSKKNLLDFIKMYQHNLIVIDNADILLDGKIIDVMLCDMNQYLVIGRNTTGLFVGKNTICRLRIENNLITFSYPHKEYEEGLLNCFGLDMSMLP